MKGLLNNRVLNPLAWWVPGARKARRIFYDDKFEMVMEVGFFTFLMLVHFVLLILAVSLVVEFPLIVVSLVVGSALFGWMVVKVTDPDKDA